jgi:hypothetical protein
MHVAAAQRRKRLFWPGSPLQSRLELTLVLLAEKTMRRSTTAGLRKGPVLRCVNARWS